MQRDYKGTYQRGQRGESATVPGLQDVYEAPLNPEVRIDTMQLSAKEAVEKVLKVVKGAGKADSDHGRSLR
jgi:adenylylsulfate kinase